jgi:hypothetical protein
LQEELEFKKRAAEIERTLNLTRAEKLKRKVL